MKDFWESEAAIYLTGAILWVLFILLLKWAITNMSGLLFFLLLL